MKPAVQEIFLSPAGYARRAGCGVYEALRHYDEIGWRNGLNPHPLFDTAYFLRRYGAAFTGKTPFEIYDAVAATEYPVTTGFFQVAWYLAGNPDIKAAHIDPIAHYVVTGIVEGRQPNPWYTLRRPSDNAADFWDRTPSFDAYIAALDEGDRIDTDWLTQAMGFPQGSAHQALWRNRFDMAACWPISPEFLLGSIKPDNFSSIEMFSNALERAMAGGMAAIRSHSA